MQAYQQKTEKSFVSEEKKFGRIDSSIVLNLKNKTKRKLRRFIVFDS